MATLDVFNMAKKQVGTVDLPDAVFGCEVKEHLLYAAVRYQRAKARAGTHKVKERAEVRGGGRKPWKQKGTGRARQGTIRAPQWRGGGIVFGPRVRSHAIKLNKKMRQQALCSALSRRAQESSVAVLEGIELKDAKTKEIAELMSRFGWKDMLLVLAEPDEVVTRCARNLPTVTVLPTDGVNVYDVLLRSNLVMTRDAVDALSKRLGG